MMNDTTNVTVEKGVGKVRLDAIQVAVSSGLPAQNGIIYGANEAQIKRGTQRSSQR